MFREKDQYRKPIRWPQEQGQEGGPYKGTIDKSVYLKAFNNQFVEFLEDIERVIPNNADVITAKNALLRLKNAHTITKNRGITLEKLYKG